ncbi:hypothetical protein EMIHUDRAFT_252286 [Emiliania huxleyi CCMP1516]|uniref:Plastid lipid-associated protein/fibrillin conserved domain-containing protein n=2 Tax=Emiliania huxleyi TaxID=2903 RepID=A0A0D3K713_EMIH1|nr:hypothetical protein EMIHUDRAFT_231716 [Emiliania huxleyi CCMP1516]XP_005789400.1 hypothetical protein EMIHUDRAFT_252286 [Emiliania huxleyi CCMP1516]EOD31548.1 hypothetical protein EMIHUDRAFT_231716 [Emiliania huxleyi CCMP1516]EOD36971.1 hypothetical protein EMIHUDRAFT_252286 [Emiliania huxleyi CCMP1516]|eukprot:XP_005783977.1 hypothetical protein EMIHUDRAFT_231716 [Emiliania huxleyi CCMP1516]
MLTLLALGLQAPVAGYDARRGIKIVQELASRSVGGPLPSSGTADLKKSILALLEPFGDPALRVPDTEFRLIDEQCRLLEARNPARGADALEALQGCWKVRYSNAPPPSNGALGPVRGAAFQRVDVPSRTYTNELSLLGAALFVQLTATFEPRGPLALRVAFQTITFSILGLRLPPVAFPPGTERTWLLTYTDEDTRLVRAGVDGGRSTARDLGLLSREEGEAADSYLFVLTRATPSESSRAPAGLPSPLAPLARAAERRRLKAQLLEACGGQSLGAEAGAEDLRRVRDLSDRLAALTPTADPASSPLLCGTWDIIWTTESELLALTKRGLLGLPCTAAYQAIARTREGGAGPWAYSLDNAIEFDGGFLRVGSTCEPAASGGRVNFVFQSCAARWRALELPLPPVGSGWFDVLYVDEELRVCRDSRGDLQVCARRK